MEATNTPSVNDFKTGAIVFLKSNFENWKVIGKANKDSFVSRFIPPIPLFSLYAMLIKETKKMGVNQRIDFL